MDSVIEFHFLGLVPDWWALQPGGCRQGAISASAGAGGLTECIDYWGSRPSTSVAAWQVLSNNEGPIGYRLRLITYTDPQFAAPVQSGVELYTGKITIDNRKSVGADSCGGCSLKGGFTFLGVDIGSLEFPAGIFESRTATRDYVLWQDALVPTRSQTWGSIKAMYR